MKLLLILSIFAILSGVFGKPSPQLDDSAVVAVERPVKVSKGLLQRLRAQILKQRKLVRPRDVSEPAVGPVVLPIPVIEPTDPVIQPFRPRLWWCGTPEPQPFNPILIEEPTPIIPQPVAEVGFATE